MSQRSERVLHWSLAGVCGLGCVARARGLPSRGRATRRRRSASARTSRRFCSRTARPATARPSPRGAIRSSTTTLLMKPGESESPSITPGKPDESELFDADQLDRRGRADAQRGRSAVGRANRAGQALDRRGGQVRRRRSERAAGLDRAQDGRSPIRRQPIAARCRSRPWPSTPTARSWP